MGLKSGRRGSESRFSAYVEALSSALGHADRAVPFHSYCAGLLLPGDRKSVEPMAARVQPGRVQANGAAVDIEQAGKGDGQQNGRNGHIHFGEPHQDQINFSAVESGQQADGHAD